MLYGTGLTDEGTAEVELITELSQAELFRYSRHLLIPEVGLEGQLKLKNAAVLVVGAGGLGSPVALYLAAAGVGRLGLVDYDVVEASNLQRQIIHSASKQGQLKVESAYERLHDLNPDIQIDIYNTPFTAENARDIAGPYDILVDGTDNFATRYLLSDLSVFSGKPYVYGSIYRFEGQVSVFDARVGPCYRCLFPEPPPPGMAPTCAEGGVFGVLPGTIGTLQATEVLKLILGIGETLVGKLVLYDALNSRFNTVQLKKNPHCAVCGPRPSVTDLVDYTAFCGAGIDGPAAPTGLREMTPQEAHRRLRSGERLTLLDVRDPIEAQVSQLVGAVSMPLYQLTTRMNELNASETVVVFCRTGARSARAAAELQAAGFTRVFNLKGGINAWAQTVDPGMRQY